MKRAVRVTAQRGRVTSDRKAQNTSDSFERVLSQVWASISDWERLPSANGLCHLRMAISMLPVIWKFAGRTRMKFKLEFIVQNARKAEAPHRRGPAKAEPPHRRAPAKQRSRKAEPPHRRGPAKAEPPHRRGPAKNLRRAVFDTFPQTATALIATGRRNDSLSWRANAPHLAATIGNLREEK